MYGTDSVISYLDHVTVKINKGKPH